MTAADIAALRALVARWREVDWARRDAVAAVHDCADELESLLGELIEAEGSDDASG